jgi:uncharacterized membrane protein
MVPSVFSKERPMPAAAKIAIATVALGVSGFVLDSLTNGGHWIFWAVLGAIYGIVCYPWFQAMKSPK